MREFLLRLQTGGFSRSPAMRCRASGLRHLAPDQLEQTAPLGLPVQQLAPAVIPRDLPAIPPKDCEAGIHVVADLLERALPGAIPMKHPDAGVEGAAHGEQRKPLV